MGITGCGIVLRSREGYRCDRTSSEVCNECGVNLCDLHAESCEVCDKTLCSRCCFSHHRNRLRAKAISVITEKFQRSA